MANHPMSPTANPEECPQLPQRRSRRRGTRRVARRVFVGGAVVAAIVIAGSMSTRSDAPVPFGAGSTASVKDARIPTGDGPRGSGMAAPTTPGNPVESATVPLPASGPGDAAAAANASPGTAKAEAGTGGSVDAVVGPIPGATPLASGPPLVRTATLDLTLRSGIDAATAQLRALASGAGGYVGSEDSTSLRGEDRSTLTLRVPSDKLDDVIAKAESLGKVRAANVASADVGAVSVDLDARISATKAQVEQLQAIAAQAKTVGEVLAVRSQLAPVQTELEQLTAQRRALADKVAMAALTVTLSRSGAASSPVAAGWWAELMAAALTRLQTVAGVMVLGIVTLAPPCLLVLAIWLVTRSVRRRRRTGMAAEQNPAVSAPTADAA